MIYCFKKLRELRLTHVFFLHYSISLLIGGAAIAGLILLGGGLQFYSVVVLCIMYTQPTFFILRRIKMYEVKHELKYGNYSVSEKFETEHRQRFHYLYGCNSNNDRNVLPLQWIDDYI